MDKGEIYRALEEEFAATFVKELIPGILHNFANPLNGIMGRSKLLQRRIDENVKKIEEIYPDTAAGMMEELKRIKNDIRAVSQESDFFFEMFRDVAGKFYALAAKAEDNINISQMLAMEMRFANFYLDFKHEIKKDIQLDKNVPDFRGSTADLSISFWRIIRFAMIRALASRQKEFYIKTEYDKKYINVYIKSSGDPLPPSEIEAIMNNLSSDSPIASDAIKDQGLLSSLLLLKEYKTKINILSEENFTTASVGLPYHAENDKKKEI